MRSRSVRVSVCGPMDPDTVWRRYHEPRWWSTWSPQICSVEYEHPTLCPGTEGVVRTFGGVGVAFMIDEVCTLDRTWTWRVVVLGLTLRMTHDVRPAGNAGSRTWLTVTGPAVISRAYAWLATIALWRLVHVPVRSERVTPE